jgi:hypothetical protein
MTFYIKNGTSYRPTDEANVNIHTTLPVGNYIIKQDMFGNMFFDTVDPFVVNFKRYGNNPRHTRRILDTFNRRDVSTGVMLAGEKGSGKSLLAKTVSIEAADTGVPTIIINSSWRGDKFNTLIQSVEQPAVILFDEFEKVYDGNEQEEILTLLDGVFPTKKLFIFTCNDKWRVNVNMRNRPGRIFYMLDFDGLDETFVREYCTDNLHAIEHISTICRIIRMFHKFNFDMLKALVEEMNRYGEPPQVALEMLNVRPEFDETEGKYTLELTCGTETFKLRNDTYSGNPLKLEFWVEYYRNETETPVDEEDAAYVRAIGPRVEQILFTSDHLVKLLEDEFVYEEQGFLLKLTRQKPKRPDWRDAF